SGKQREFQFLGAIGPLTARSVQRQKFLQTLSHQLISNRFFAAGSCPHREPLKRCPAALHIPPKKMLRMQSFGLVGCLGCATAIRDPLPYSIYPCAGQVLARCTLLVVWRVPISQSRYQKAPSPVACYLTPTVS